METLAPKSSRETPIQSVDSTDQPAMLNLLEPVGLIAQFLAHPPDGFFAATSKQGVPFFVARFDLLTTADSQTKRLLASLPLYRWWKKLLQPYICFFGTTVTEYAPLPTGTEPGTLIEQLKASSSRYAFLIVKDIPQDSPLLDEASKSNTPTFYAACARAGFVILEGQALAYVPIDFISIDEYLMRLSSRRRKDIRRKLRTAAELQIEAVPTGDEQFAGAMVRAQIYALYLNVYNQSELRFDLLSPTFFDAILQDASSGGIVFVYRHAGRMIGFNLCFVTRGNLVDKYVGFVYPQARELNLYFVSWIHNLEYALANGLRHYIAGWTDPEIKAYLGAKFTFTRHAVYVRNRLLRAALRRFARRFEHDRAWQDAKTNEPSLGHS